MNLIADVFRKLRTTKNVIRYISEKSRFGEPFERQHAKRAQTLLQSQRQNCYLIYWSF